MKIAVVGVTGLVGSIMLKVLEEKKIPVTELIPVASDKSKGKNVVFHGKQIPLSCLADALEKKPDIALFSAGGGVSLEWAPKFANTGAYVIDNSSAWRMDKGKKLVVPEINSNILTKDDHIIANPNCSTIQLVMALNPLHEKYRVKRLVISTYQSITGSGIKAVRQMENEREGGSSEKFYPHVIDKNCLPHCDVFQEGGYTKEELKLVNETHKILNDHTIGITATAVRVPVEGGHSESVNVEFETDFEMDEIRGILSKSQGIVLQDTPNENLYPMPVTSYGKDEVFVGRLRRDFSQKNSLNMWIVSDNLRKGAATNAVQIVEYIIGKGFV
ncbi:MAG: aspartate-semialdehyde dehydrogenase [Chlorobi bacterium]|nr:aspartate-semialdehyde dehydrogenase [Chlorobiota bacterium]